MKPRLHYFDMLKGIAIFMVVMGHVLTMCVREIDRAAIFKFIGEVHMPLFFFISGWMAMRLGEGGNVATPALLPRAKRLLLPMLGASTLWLYYFPLSGLESPLVSTWEGLWSNEWKNGYWFTLVLFEIFAVYAAITPLLSRCRNVWGGIAVTAAAWAVMLACQAIMPPMWVGISSLGLAATFFPIFMAGALAKKHKDGFGRICESSGAVTAALIVTALCLAFVCWPWKYGFANEYNLIAARVILHLSLAVIAVATVKPWSERAFSPERSAPGRLADMWRFIGTRSLSVYLLHYFFLFPLGAARPALEALGLSFTPLFVFSATVAAAIVALALCADYILSFSKPLSLLLTGSEPPKQPSVTK